MTPIYYSSTDASAPVLSGTLGSLIALLRAILVTGYGSKAAAGWTEPFAAASDVAVFRVSTSRAEGQYLRVDDSGGGAGGAREAFVRGYATMTDLATGTELTPTTAQLASGLVWPKSLTADSTAQVWRALATDRWVYLLINFSGHWLTWFAGVYEQRFVPSVARFLLVGHQIANASTSSHFGADWRFRGFASAPTAQTTLTSAHTSVGYVMRQAGGGPGAALASLVQIAALAGSSPGKAGVAYPDAITGGTLLTRVGLSDGANRLVGVLPNMYAPQHVRPHASLADITGPGASTLTAFVVPDQYPYWASDAGRGQILLDRTTQDTFT